MSDNGYEYGVNRAASAVISLCAKVIFIVLAVVMIYIAVDSGFKFGRSLFYVDPAEAAPGRDVEITITEYDTYESLGEKLYEAGVITNELSFLVQGTLYQAELFPGTYTVNTSQTIRDMLLDIDETAEALESQAAAEAEAQAAAESAEEVLTGGGEGD